MPTAIETKVELEDQFNQVVKAINDHTKSEGQYCKCDQCKNNRCELNSLSDQINSLDLGPRKAAF